MDSIEALERRISALELQLRRPADGVAEPPLLDTLQHLDTMLATALSGRDVITALFGRLEELDADLDPAWGEGQLSRAAKLQYVVAVLPELRRMAELIQRLRRALPVLDSKAWQQAADLEVELAEQKAHYAQLNEEALQVSNGVAQVLRQYSDMAQSISAAVVAMEEAVSNLEARSVPAKRAV